MDYRIVCIKKDAVHHPPEHAHLLAVSVAIYGKKKSILHYPRLSKKWIQKAVFLQRGLAQAKSTG